MESTARSTRVSLYPLPYQSMTLCANGSSANPSAPPYAWITWIEAQSWLGLAWGKFSWLAQLLQPLLVDVTNFCLTEPTQPVYPGDAVLVASATNPVAFQTILQYIKDSAIWYAWSTLCQCNASGSPGCIAQLFSHSSNLASNYDWTGSTLAQRFVVNGTGYTLWGLDVDHVAAGAGQIIWLEIGGTINNFTNVTFSSGWHRYYFSSPLTLQNGHTYEVYVRMSTSGGTNTMYYQSAAPSRPALLSSWDTRILPWDLSTDTPVGTLTYGIDPVICLGSPAAYAPAGPSVPVTSVPSLPTTTCTTVSDLCAIVNPLVSDIGLLKGRLDLLQRRLLPFAYILGATSGGLTGAGSITVSDILGVVVFVSTVPTRWGYTSDSPRRLIPSVGSVQAVTNDGYEDWQLVHYEHQIIMFDPAIATIVRYNFKPGIVASITLIHPEP